MENLLRITENRVRVLSIIIIGVAIGVSRADTISGTGWRGTNGENWSTYGSWDSNPPTNGTNNERNLFFGDAYTSHGGTTTTSYNDIASNYSGYRITFQDDGSGNNHSFTINGDGATLYDFNGNSPSIENDSYLTQEINIALTMQSASNSNTAYFTANHGDLVFGGNVTVQSSTNLHIVGVSDGASAVRLNGSTTNSTTINVDSTGILGGGGTISGPVTVNGIITAGPDAATTGTLTTGSQTWNSGGKYLAKFSSDGTTVSNDKLIMSGLTLSADSGNQFIIKLISYSSLTLSDAFSYLLARDTSDTTDMFSLSALNLMTENIYAPTGDSLRLGTYKNTAGGFDLVLNVAAPEPTSFLLFGLVAAPLVLRRRRVTVA